MSYFTLGPGEAKRAIRFMNHLLELPDDHSEGRDMVEEFFVLVLGYDEVLGLPECADTSESG